MVFKLIKHFSSVAGSHARAESMGGEGDISRVMIEFKTIMRPRDDLDQEEGLGRSLLVVVLAGPLMHTTMPRNSGNHHRDRMDQHHLQEWAVLDLGALLVVDYIHHLAGHKAAVVVVSSDHYMVLHADHHYHHQLLLPGGSSLPVKNGKKVTFHLR